MVHVALGLLAAASAAAAIGLTAADEVPVWLWVAVAASWLGVFAAAVRTPRSGAAIVAGSVLVLWPLAALASLGMLVVWLVGLLPGSWTAKVRTFQLALAGSVGDTFALVSSPRRERAMFDAITSAAQALLTELDKETEKTEQTEQTGKTKEINESKKSKPPRPLVVAAHSQGASLMYRLLDRDPCFRPLLKGRNVTLVTYGTPSSRSTSSSPVAWGRAPGGRACTVSAACSASCCSPSRSVAWSPEPSRYGRRGPPLLRSSSRD